MAAIPFSCGKRALHGGAAVLVLLSLAAGSPAPSRADGPPEPRPLGREVPTYQAPADPAAPPLPEAMAEPTGTLTLGQALRESLTRSPALAAFSWEVRARDAELIQAGAFPNPELSTEVEDFAGSGDRSGFRGSQTTLSFAQLVELGGKRGKRTRVAALERDLAGWDYEAARLGVLTDTTKAFVATLALQERVRLAGELHSVASESLRSVEAAVHAGATSPVEASRAAVAVEQAGIAKARLERELDAARAALAASWGASSAEFDAVAGDLSSTSTPPAFDTLARTLSANPDLARWSTERAQREATLALERAKRVPDVTLAVGPRYYASGTTEGSGSALVAGLSFPIPLWNQNSGGILQAEYRVKRAANEEAAAQASASAQLRIAYAALAAAQAEAQGLEQRAVPEAEKAYSGALRSYRAGLFRYVEVLDAQRTLFELRAAVIDALAAYHTAAADLERLTGTPLTDLQSTPRP